MAEHRPLARQRTERRKPKVEYALMYRGKFVEMGTPWTLHSDPQKATRADTIPELLHTAFLVTYKAGNMNQHFHQGHGDIKLVRLEHRVKEVK